MELSDEIGRALRQVRLGRDMTLREAAEVSGGRFKPSSIAGYERAERAITVQRFCELSGIYGVAPDRLLTEILRRVRGEPIPTIVRSRIASLPEHERTTVARFVDQVARLRAQDEGAVVRVRVRDLEVLATATGHKLDDFLDQVRPALKAEVDGS